MSNAEHLIENAIIDMEDNKDFEYFSSQWHNKEMASESGINLDHVWAMAQHVVYTLKPIWISDKESEMEDLYGYRLDQRNYLR